MTIEQQLAASAKRVAEELFDLSPAFVLVAIRLAESADLVDQLVAVYLRLLVAERKR